jgi:hypothetical protein
MRIISISALALALAAVLVPQRARAVEPLDTFSFRIGGYVTNFDTEVRADGTTGRGTELDLQRDFGLDDSAAVGFVGFTWRPWEAHEFGLNYYQDDADATRTITRDLTFRDTTFLVNSTLSADVGIDAYEGYYVWWAAQRENWALGPRVGLLWYRMNIELALLVDANGNQVGGAVRREANADIPSITLGGAWRWTPGGSNDWRIGADAGWFQANINDIDANVTFGRIGVEWFPWERSGFSLDYTVSKIGADADTSDFVGNLDFIDSGIKLGYTYRW